MTDRRLEGWRVSRRQKSEVRSQKTEVRRQKTEDRSQKTEGWRVGGLEGWRVSRKQKSEDRRQKTEDRRLEGWRVSRKPKGEGFEDSRGRVVHLEFFLKQKRQGVRKAKDSRIQGVKWRKAEG